MKDSNTLLRLARGLCAMSLALTFSVSAALAGPSSPPQPNRPAEETGARARMRDYSNEQIASAATLRKSTELYGSMVKGPQGEIPANVLARAECVAVLPEVATGAVVIGGSHGTGVVSCRENNRWSAPAFVKLSQMSIGVQLGGKSSDIVLFISDQKGKQALLNGSLALGADASVAAGSFGGSAATTSAGVISYTRSGGAFAGASLSGGTLASDDQATEAYYGKGMKTVPILEGKSTVKSNNEIEKFIAMLPRH